MEGSMLKQESSLPNLTLVKLYFGNYELKIFVKEEMRFDYLSKK
jgi:hypothetical protein